MGSGCIPLPEATAHAQQLSPLPQPRGPVAFPARPVGPGGGGFLQSLVPGQVFLPALLESLDLSHLCKSSLVTLS